MAMAAQIGHGKGGWSLGGVCVCIYVYIFYFSLAYLCMHVGVCLCIWPWRHKLGTARGAGAWGVCMYMYIYMCVYIYVYVYILFLYFLSVYACVKLSSCSPPHTHSYNNTGSPPHQPRATGSLNWCVTSSSVLLLINNPPPPPLKPGWVDRGLRDNAVAHSPTLSSKPWTPMWSPTTVSGTRGTPWPCFVYAAVPRSCSQGKTWAPPPLAPTRSATVPARTHALIAVPALL